MAENDTLALLAELVEASKGYMGCQQPRGDAEQWPCGECWGCRLEAAVQRAEKRIGVADRVAQGLDHIGRKAALMHATANRYHDLSGGSEDPVGELWGWLATLADLVAQLSGWVLDDRAIAGSEEEGVS